MSDHAQEIEWSQWLGPELDFDSGLMHMQVPGLVPGATVQGRSPLQGPPADHGRLQASATQTKPRFLRFVQESQEVEQGGDSTGLIVYDLLWKITNNGRAASDDTERKLTVAPTVYLKEVLYGKIALARSRKGLGKGKEGVRVVDFNVIVSMTGRPAKKVNRRFSALDVELSFAEREMVAWAEERRPGQEFQIQLTVNIETQKGTTVSRSDNNRGGRASATTRMLSECRDVIEREEVASRRPAVWPSAMQSARCLDKACRNQGQYCQIESDGRHTPLRSGELYQHTKQAARSQRDALKTTQPANQVGENSRKRKSDALEIASRSPVSVYRPSLLSQRSEVSSTASKVRRDVSKLSTLEINRI